MNPTHGTSKAALRYTCALLLCSLSACDAPPPSPTPAAPSQEHPVTRTNRLAKEKSPYLLQHAHNPVDWYPWGDEAFAKAKAEDKPVFLSVGYSTCHWCHVMERESFENDETAKVLNERFVAIKVDREERPDVDEIYMEAVQAMNDGSGGWPMSVFLTPEGRPFFAGTYFPPEDRYGRPGFRTLLERIAELWKTQRADIERNGEAMAKLLAESPSPPPSGEPDRALLENAVKQMTGRYDARHGGFGGAPKFPPAMALMFLMREASGDAGAMKIVAHTLDAMARGGMYDQVGGGFARYSTDAEWLIPHFEKMLYDNALLARCYAEAFQVTGNAYYERIAREILDYVLREMTAPGGAFWSATDADSEGEEGKYFVWTPEEIAGILGKDEGAAFCDYFGVTEAGNFEHGTSVLHVAEYDEAAEARFRPAKAKLYEARKKRIPPHLDDKILVSWNGLMISALAIASGALGEPRYRDAAERAAAFLLKECVVDGRLMRGHREGVMRVKGFLDDHALLAAGLLDLYEATGSLHHFRDARRIAADLSRLFEDEKDGAFWATGSDQEKLIARRKDPYDGAVPSGISVAANVQLRLAEMTGDDALRQSALRAWRPFLDRVRRFPPAQPEMLKGMAMRLAPARQIVVSGKPGAADFEALAAESRRVWRPHSVLAFATGEAGEEKEMAILEGRGPKEKAAAYVCEGNVCRQPVFEGDGLRKALRR